MDVTRVARPGHTGSPQEQGLSSANSDPQSKRRKLRKGTNSCWACKRRKVKCTFASPSDTICISCQQRRAACVSQEFPEEVSPGGNGFHTSLESLPARHIGGVPECEQTRFIGVNASSAGNDTSLANLPVPTTASPISTATKITQTDARKLAQLSHALHSMYPSQKDIDILYGIGQKVSIYFHQVNTRSRKTLEDEGLAMADTVVKLPGPDVHPLLLVRSMLIFILFLQTLPAKELGGLSEPPEVIKGRLADTAASFLASNRNMLKTIEGLECLILEGVCQSNKGNLRQAWFSIRTAMSLAMLMGMHRPYGPPPRIIDPSTKINARFMWFRLVYKDRFLCLLLGLPQGTTDMSMASEAALTGDTQLGKLERLHTAIAGRILERNESDPSLQDFSITQDIDLELQKVARSLPSKFWLPPTFSDLEQHSPSVFWRSLRLSSQAYHYYLLTQLHLPYMLRFSAERKHEFSKIACANASREILIRFVLFRGFNHTASCCRVLDFFALMAAMTLILAHLDGHQHDKVGNLLVHQRQGDRAMMEQVLENMDLVRQHSHDALSEKSAKLLRRMLAIEADATDGGVYSTQRIGAGEDQQHGEEEADVLRVCMPSFGTVKITRKYAISKELRQPPLIENEGRQKETVSRGSVHAYYRNLALELDSALPSSEYADYSEDPFSCLSIGGDAQQAHLGVTPTSGTTAAAESREFQSPGVTDIRQQNLGTTVDMDNWTFQGVDTAFFESLMRGTGMPDMNDNSNPDWVSWQGDLGDYSGPG